MRTMKKFLLLALLICGCVSPHRQSGANKAAEDYVRKMLNNPNYLESVSFTELEKKRYPTALDTSLTDANIGRDDYKKMQKFVDSENGVRPDISMNNTRDLDNIKHGRLNYYAFVYTFRIDSAGYKKLMKYRFELDSLNNVLNAKDITHVWDGMQSEKNNN
jgi:hypothetical protein